MRTKPLLSVIVPAFNACEKVQKMLNAMKKCLSGKDGIEVIIVDDGSEIQLNIDAYQQANPFIKTIRNDRNLGRATTRNIGARISNAEYLLFLDVDCIPCLTFFDNALLHIENDASLVFGHIQFQSDPFFEYCENNVQQKRTNAMDHWYLVLTTANCLIKKKLFYAIDGFSEKYRHYGMEDRDLLIRLHKKIPDLSVLYSYDMLVYHEDHFNIQSYLNRFIMQGKYTIPIFRTDHPEEYKQMNYAIFDYHMNPWLNRLPLPFVQWLGGVSYGLFFALFTICPNYILKEYSLKMLKGIAILKGTSGWNN